MLPRILVADDEPANVLIIARALRDEFEVVEASTGPEVLERVARGDIDLVLLDVLMPGLDGFDVCRRLKSDPASAGIPVIFVTALEEIAEEARGFDVGAVDYITKPIRPSIVKARVRTHIELKRTRDLLEQLASVDPLTGIPNRRRFDAAIAEEWRRARRRGRWLSLALVDVDLFKQFNDRFGHMAGDERLRRIAAALVQSTRRAGELAARYGGEEFGLILPDVDSAMMHGFMRALLSGVSLAHSPAVTPGGPEITTVSVGAISVLPARDMGESGALATADTLLYEAKGRGRDCCVHQDLVSQEKTLLHRLGV